MNTKPISPILYRILSVSTVLLLAFSSFGGALAQTPATYIVNTTDDRDHGLCNVIHCSLREAIKSANKHQAADTIEFNIPGGPPFTIQPRSALPEITDPVMIDGTTQPGYDDSPIVELDGTNAVDKDPDVLVNGLVISAGGSTVRGLVINRFSGDGVVLTRNGGNTIEGNFIGTDVTGTLALGNSLRGVVVQGGSSVNLIGGTGAYASNLISGNGAAGVRLSDAGTEGNQVQGNFIGTDTTGMSRLGNGLGIRVTNGAANNLIGGTEDGARNVISGNRGEGLYIDMEEGEGTTGNIVQGNYIGTDVTGSATTPPAVGEYTVTALDETCPTYPAETDFDGFVSGSNDPSAPWSGTSVTFLGTDECTDREMLGEASLIYRYKLEFVEPTQLTSIAVSGAAFNGPDSVLRVLDEEMNVLGTAVTYGGNSFQIHFVTLQNVVGKVFFVEEFDTSTTWRYRERILINTCPIGNYLSGVDLAEGAWDNLITGNLISGNMVDGVVFEAGATGNTIQGNLIGLDSSGNTALPNYYGGVEMWDAANNLIAGNVLSGNGGSPGIGMVGVGTTGNIIRGNLIGTNADGTAPVPNSDGIWMGEEANNNTIGGTTAEERNVISGNGHYGVSLNVAASENLILGNYIGTDETGTLPLGNDWGGVFLGSGSNHNTIGGTQAGTGNIISGNGGDGVIIADPGTSENIVQGNFIGTDVTGMVALGNSLRGVFVAGGASSNFIGGNLISGNGAAGVRFSDVGTEGNKVQGNFIGTDITGVSPLGNGYVGIRISDGVANNMIGGTEPGAGNTIAFNASTGIALSIAAGSGNALLSNSVFLNGGLGIDLGEDGVTPNDRLDQDTGPNDLQNFPVITAVRRVGRNVMIYGTLDSTPSTIFRLEFFSNDACDPSGYGEGQAFLGFIMVTTDPAGISSFNVTLPVSLPRGAFITATATDPAGSTSEFSQCFGPAR